MDSAERELHRSDPSNLIRIIPAEGEYWDIKALMQKPSFPSRDQRVYYFPGLYSPFRVMPRHDFRQMRRAYVRGNT